MKLALFITALALLLLSGCIVRQVQVVCNEPYMIVGAECCLDKDSNKICDYDETVPVDYESKDEALLPEENSEEKTKNAGDTDESPEQPASPKYFPLTTALRSVVVVDVVKDDEIVGYGSGFFADSEGYVLTNTHVVDEYDPTEVTYRVGTYSGTEYNASLIDWSWDYDIALLKIQNKPNYNMPHLEFGSIEDTRLGDEVYVLGSPMGLEFSIAKGILSSKDREGLRNEKITEYIQMDAALNPGNSGGPVVTSEGKVIGIATFGYMFLEGLNFALESDAAKRLYLIMKTEKTAVPDASLPKCRISNEVYAPVLSSYGFKNKGSSIEGKKPSELDIFYKEADDKIRFGSITATFLNKGGLTRELCFHAKIMNKGEVIFNQDVGEPLEIEPNTMITNYPIQIDFITDYDKDWYYYELTAQDCKTREELYNFYRKDRFDMDHRKGDVEIYENCKSYFTLTASANI